MGRLHLFEFEDFAWFPSTIRDLMTDYLRQIVHALRLYEPIAAQLAEVLERTGYTKLVDLCSGGGGMLPGVHRELQRKHRRAVSVSFTDLYPSESLHDLCKADPAHLSVVSEPVNATRVPGHLTGFRTMFSALHHFKPSSARGILEDAVRQRVGIGIFETTERSLSGFLSMMLMPLGVLLFTPAIRPLTFERLFFTYLIPVVPFFIWWDGLVSSVRTYSPAELGELTRGLDDGGYRFEIGRRPVRAGVKLTYLLGFPAEHEVTP